MPGGSLAKVGRGCASEDLAAYLTEWNQGHSIIDSLFNDNFEDGAADRRSGAGLKWLGSNNRFADRGAAHCALECMFYPLQARRARNNWSAPRK